MQRVADLIVILDPCKNALRYAGFRRKHLIFGVQLGGAFLHQLIRDEVFFKKRLFGNRGIQRHGCYQRSEAKRQQHRKDFSCFAKSHYATSR